jgi:glutamate carboxypeptidase
VAPSGKHLENAGMDPNALPFDSDAMLAGLREWVECESPTFDPAAVNRMMDIASRALVLAGARIERVAGRMGLGDCVRATFPHATPDVPGILVMGHLDTVHPIGTLEKLPFRREGGRAWGPGIQDNCSALGCAPSCLLPCCLPATKKSAVRPRAI